jgi:glutamyl-tRNA synthetase
MREVRVRFAPSPTGSLHIGGVRTALYNYLIARKAGGKFIIRIEDTDQTRFVPGAEQYIYNSLEWLGLVADESPLVGGPHAPYRQSERMHIYAGYAKQLIDSDCAYYAFDTSEELDAARKAVPDNTFQYNAATRMDLRNSLSLSKKETEDLLQQGVPHVIRLKVPKKDEIRLNDLIRGWVMVHSSTMDDKVLLKSDGMPTYHLANVVDDYLMNISHVIRGEEWLPSAPTHVLLYRFFGWEDRMPQFAHLPLLLKPTGDGKLSKRDGEAHGFPVFPLQWFDDQRGINITGYKEEGYLPEALLNFLALLGWNPGTEQEMFSLEELVQSFSIERIGKAGTRFDIQKARWFNQHYLQLRPDSYFVDSVRPVVEKAGLNASDENLSKWIHLVKERSTFLRDVVSEIQSVVSSPDEYDEAIVSSKWNDDARKGLSHFAQSLLNLSEWDTNSIKLFFTSEMENLGIKPGKVLQMLRVALTGKGAGPDLMTIIELLGKVESSKRIDKALTVLS